MFSMYMVICSQLVPFVFFLLILYHVSRAFMICTQPLLLFWNTPWLRLVIAAIPLQLCRIGHSRCQRMMVEEVEVVICTIRGPRSEFRLLCRLIFSHGYVIVECVGSSLRLSGFRERVSLPCHDTVAEISKVMISCPDARERLKGYLLLSWT